MYRKFILPMILTAGISLTAQTVNITGKVTKSGGTGISGAVVKLSSKNLSATTDASGNYTLKGTTAVNTALTGKSADAISIRNGILAVDLIQTEPVKIELFDIQGNLIQRMLHKPATAGNYKLDLMKTSFTSNLMMIRVSIGQSSSTFRYLPLSNSLNADGTSDISSPTLISASLLSSVDSLQVSASGYTSKTVKITSYETTVDISLETANCQATASKSANKSVKGTGPHKVVIETNSDAGIKCGTIYRPEDLGPGKNYPIFVWGEGGCSQNGFSNVEAMGEFASWGYFIIADGTPNGTGSCSGGQDGKSFLAFITWAIEQNKNPCSAYYQSLDTTKIGADGFSCGGLMAENVSSDPRFTAVGITSSGLQSPNDNIYNKIHTPFKIMNGGPSNAGNDMAYSNGLRDYEKISALGKPIIYFSKTNSGHGTGLQDPKGDYNTVNLAWINWQLKDDTGATGKALLIGNNCKFCKASGWEFKSANIQ